MVNPYPRIWYRDTSNEPSKRAAPEPAGPILVEQVVRIRSGRELLPGRRLDRGAESAMIVHQKETPDRQAVEGSQALRSLSGSRGDDTATARHECLS